MRFSFSPLAADAALLQLQSLTSKNLIPIFCFNSPNTPAVHSQLHDAAVAEGTMGQMLVWLSFAEIFGTAATIQMLQGSGRKPGDFGFDPLGLGKGADRSRLELAETELCVCIYV